MNLMRYTLPSVRLCAAAVWIALLVACAAPERAREALVPNLRSEWPVLRPLAELGAPRVPAAVPAIPQVDAALAAGDGTALQTAWPPVEAAARAGVDVRLEARQLGPNGADLARNHITQFSRAVSRLAGGTRATQR